MLYFSDSLNSAALSCFASAEEVGFLACLSMPPDWLSMATSIADRTANLDSARKDFDTTSVLCRLSCSPGLLRLLKSLIRSLPERCLGAAGQVLACFVRI